VDLHVRPFDGRLTEGLRAATPGAGEALPAVVPAPLPADAIQLDGKTYLTLDIDAVRAFNLIREAEGRRVTGPQIVKRLKLPPSTRIDRELDKLPPALRQRIEGKTRTGYRFLGVPA
jgi:hypothetical protein